MAKQMTGISNAGNGNPITVPWLQIQAGSPAVLEAGRLFWVMVGVARTHVAASSNIAVICLFMCSLLNLFV